MIRLGKLTDYGLLLMTLIARDPRRAVHTARELAAQSKLPLPTVSKLLKELLHGGLLISIRGLNGGYSLARDAQEISMAEIVTAIEGPISLTECSTDVSGSCDLERGCPIKHNQRIISHVISAALEKVSLAELSRPLNLIAMKGAQGVQGNFVPLGKLASERTQ